MALGGADGQGHWGAIVQGFEMGEGSVAPSAGSNSSASTMVRLGRVVIGYNHDVPYAGRSYHVQTEDSGRAKGHIFTHVFHAGVIVASNKVGYGSVVHAVEIVELAKGSHKQMIRQLVHGGFDEDIVRCLGGPRAHETRPKPSMSDAVAPKGLQNHRFLAEDSRGVEESLDMDLVTRLLDELRTSMTGVLGVALVDYRSGVCLGTSGGGIDLSVAAVGNMEVMKAKARVMRDLGIPGGIEDMLITLDAQLHILRPVGTALFLYLALDREQGNLALARHKLALAAAEVQRPRPGVAKHRRADRRGRDRGTSRSCAQ